MSDSTSLSAESTTSPATSAIPGLTVEQHREHIVASGISDFVALKYGLRGGGRLDALELGFKGEQARDGLLLPLYWGGSKPILYQLRPWVPRIAPGGKPIKYETPVGKPNVLATYPAWVDAIPAPHVPLIFTEGTKKLLAWATKLQYQGERKLRLNDIVVPDPLAISLMGVRGWMGANEFGGLGVPLAALREIPFRGKDAKGEFKRQVVLAFDSDVMTKPDVHDALAAFHDYLVGRGAEVWIMYLPSAGGAKVGLDDFLAAGHSLQDALNCCEPKLRPLASREALPVLRFADLLTLPTLPWTIEGLLTADGVTVIYGSFASYKSFIVLDWLAAVAGGAADWLGLPIRRHGPVVYIYAEGRAGIGQRAQAVKLARYLTDDTPLYVVPTPISITEPAAVDALLGRLRQVLGDKQPVLIAIDTVSRNMPGKDENATVDMAAFVGGCDQLRRAFGEAGCQIIAVHHPNKQDEMRGNLTLPNSVDTTIRVGRPANLTATLTVEKQKDADNGPVRTVTLRPEAQSLVLAGMQDKDGPGGKQADTFTPDQRDVFQIFAEHGEPMALGDWIKQAIEELEVSKGLVCKTRSIASTGNLIQKVKGKRWALTNHGREYASKQGWTLIA